MSEAEEKANSFAAKKLARLVAVQALYRASFAEETLGDIIAATLDQAQHIIEAEDDTDGLPVLDKPDPELFAGIVNGVSQNQETLEEMVKGALDSRFSFDRMEKLLKNILLAGAYELHHHADIQSGIIINDYVDVARAFFGAREPGLVNAVLDKLSKKLRG